MSALFNFVFFVLFYKLDLAFLVSKAEICHFRISKKNYMNDEEEDADEDEDDEAFFVIFCTKSQ